MTRRDWRLGLALLVALALTVAACGGEEATETTAAPTETTAAPTETTAAPTETTAAPVEGTFLERALAGEFSGGVVTALGPFTDADEVIFNDMVKTFEDATGIDVQYTGTKEFEATIKTRVDAGDAPDVVDFPQPGLLGNFVAQGKVIDASTFLDVDALAANYNQSWLDMATMEGPDGPIMAGIWERVNGKSLVWYAKDDFEAAGYAIPTTWDELLALTEQIKADGDTPWCFGIESGAATGWPATDWTEEMMLRTTSLENYDKWVSGELDFASPEVQKAIETWSDLLLTEGNVAGGGAAIVGTFFGDAPKPMFEDPPKCWLHKQGNFITSFFPEGTEAGTDYGFFYLPGIDPAYGSPVLVAGDIWATFADKPEAKALIEWFTKGEHLKPWLAVGGAISPHNDSDLTWYGSDVERGIAEIILNATSLRFDASDLMPGQVGAGSFWTGMTDYVSGTKDLTTVLGEIDASWPTS